MKKKVVLLSPYSLGASSSRILYYLSRNLSLDKKLFLLEEDKYGKTRKENWFVYTSKAKNSANYPSYLFRVIKLLIKEKPDIIHYSKPHPRTLIPALIYKKLFNCKLVFECDDWEPFVQKELGAGRHKIKLMENLMKIGLENSDAIIIPNNKIMKYIPEKFHSKVLYIPNGTDTKKFKPMPRKEDSFFRLAFVGNLHKLDPLLPLVDAISIARRYTQNLKCSIIGSGVEEKRLKKIIDEKNLGEIFELKGSFSHEKIPGVLSNVDTFVLPYKNTPGIQELGVKLFEYMALQKPIIATSIGTISEVLEQGKAGILAPADSPGGLAKAIKWVHDHPKEAAEKAAYARKLAIKKYDWKVLSKQLEKIYEKI